MKTQSCLFPRFAVALCALTACASSPTPVANVASAEAAVRAADESGARQTPDAALHLHYAELQRAEGQRLMKDGENEQAALRFRRAEADANLAVALAHEAEAKRTADEATHSVQANQPASKMQPFQPMTNTPRSN